MVVVEVPLGHGNQRSEKGKRNDFDLFISLTANIPNHTKKWLFVLDEPKIIIFYVLVKLKLNAMRQRNFLLIVLLLNLNLQK